MRIHFKRPFAQFVKKAHKPLQLAIADTVDDICQSPELGELKVGDLADIRVYKFRFNRQEYLVAYRLDATGQALEVLGIDFYQVGGHENFYDALKQYLRKKDES